MNDDDTLRLIANPHLFKKNKPPSFQINYFTEKLTNLLEKEYKQTIDPEIINTIEDTISSLMNDYLIKQYVYQFVDDCIHGALQNFN